MPVPAQDLNPDTHNPAAQASAGRLILLLRKDFKDKGPALRPNATSSTATAAAEEASQPNAAIVLGERLSSDEKEYLKELLDAKIISINCDDKTVRIPPSVSTSSPYFTGIHQFIHYIQQHKNESPFNNSETRKAVFSEIQRMINLGCDHWTKNKVYVDSKSTIVDASLGETVSLVCLALVGDAPMLRDRYRSIVSRHLDPTKTEEENINLAQQARILSLFNCLHKLSTDPKCTGGRQHDLLYLLNGVYPEQKPDKSVEPILLVEDVNDFILNKLFAYLCVKINELPDKQRIGLLCDWMLHATEHAVDEMPASLTTFLRGQNNEEIAAYLTKSCVEQGFSPEGVFQPIRNIISNITELNPPNDADPAMPSLLSVLTTKQDNDQSDCDQTARTYISRNIARDNLIALITNDKIPSFAMIKEVARYFLEAEALYQTIKKYQTISIFTGKTGDIFKSALNNCMEQLQQRFTHIQAIIGQIEGYQAPPVIELHITLEQEEAFQTAKKDFLTSEEQFKEAAQIDFIDNFFVMLSREPDNVAQYLQRLQSEHQKHPLTLSDAILTGWLAKLARSNSREPVEITPYGINRIFMHALLTLSNPIANAWNVFYKKTLIEIVKCVHAQKNNSDRNIQQAMRVYPDNLLSNCLVAALTNTNGMPWVRSVLTIHTSAAEFCQNDFFLCTLLENLNTTRERDAVFSAIKNDFNIIIQNNDQLCTLFSLSPAQLSLDQRTIILDAVKGKLSTLIQNDKQLYALFKLSSTQLSLDQRAIILTAVQNNLKTLIHSGNQFYDLFALSTAQLSLDQRVTIWNAVAATPGDLRALIQNTYQFRNLFALSPTQLSMNQRELIWNAVAATPDDLRTLIQSGTQLRFLFALPNTQLSIAQRTLIWNAVAATPDNLGALIRDSKELCFLFALPDEKLSRDQRIAIWNAVKENTEVTKNLSESKKAEFDQMCVPASSSNTSAFFHSPSAPPNSNTAPHEAQKKPN